MEILITLASKFLHDLQKTWIGIFIILLMSCTPHTLGHPSSFLERLGIKALIYVGGYLNQIGDTKYHFTGSDIILQYIWRDGKDSIGVNFRVVKYGDNFKYIVAVRQVAKAYNCDDGSIPVELLDKYEYWVIELSSDKVSGPMSYEDFLSMANNNFWLKKLDLGSLDAIREENIKKGHKEIKLRQTCMNPKPID